VVALVAVAAALGGLAACGGSADSGHGPSGAGGDAVLGEARDAPLPESRIAPVAEALPQRTLKPMPAARLADGLTPPTNKWFSGLVFGSAPQPVFPLPLAFLVDDAGFGFGLPQVVTSATSIVGSHQEDVSVTVAGVGDQVVSAYDDASFTLSALDDQGLETGRTVVAEGSPFVTHLASDDENLETSADWTATGDYLTAETPTGTYGLVVRDGHVDARTIVLEPGGSAVFFPVPDDGDPAAMAALATPVEGTSSSYDVGESTVSTTITYGSSPTAFAVLPHQAGDLDGDVSCDLGTFPSVYGDLALCSGDALTWSVPRRHAVAGLDLTALDDADRAALAEQVTLDVADAPDPPADTYFGGKWLYREAQLLEIADEVGAADAARSAQRALTEQLELWTDPAGCSDRAERCFVYDPQWHAVVGLAAAFGSDELNDHHFHYGYFLNAAGVLAQHDPSVVDRIRPVMDLLAADVAGGSDTGTTPRLRAFDVYAGHSWASGASDFADGNNQESSSEAVNAWAGLSLWATATDDDDLAAEAAWLLSAEAASARAYWTDAELPAGFDHRVVGINWGGKRDYATWFSPEPTAILGIQLIPMSPSSSYLADDPERVAAAVAEAGSTGPLGDYVLMYSALSGAGAARAASVAARTLPEDAIDDGDSRSYLMAFTMAHQK
jgi:endo-1,3(4)-beta-glucanase